MKTKVKLVAIAKDEAAYLPEWIFHHLYFGFDHIEIHVNNTIDNTWELQDIFSHDERVQFVNADHIFLNTQSPPQQQVYIDSYRDATNSGFSHVFYIDIDEFWVPKNLKSTIKDCISTVDADVICFEWLNKIEKKQFSEAIDSNEIKVEHHRLVKSIVKTGLDLSEIKVHKITDNENVVHRLANGELAYFKSGRQQLVDEKQSIKDYFILHRMYRSELEYISLLGRGRALTTSISSSFKNNRDGFCVTNNRLTTVSFNKDDLEYYSSNMMGYLVTIPDTYIDEAKNYINLRYEKVIELIENAELYELSTISKILTNVSDSRACMAFSKYLQNIVSDMKNEMVDLMRDGSIALEGKNLQKAYQLMCYAGALRPSGKLIRKKIEEYKSRI